MANILVIEDDELVASAIEAVLMKAGHTVTLAGNGELGLTKFAAAPADLVVTDIIMPRKDGRATMRELRARAPHLPIIAISGGGRAKSYDFLRTEDKSGVTEVLYKPFSNSELIATVSKLLGLAGGA